MAISRYITLTILFFSLRSTSSNSVDDNFLKCFSSRTMSPDIVLSHESSNYTSTLEALIRNKRFMTTSTPKPSFIITPKHESHIQAAILCGKENGMEMRMRSGGHDFEGLSYVSYDRKYVVIDLFNMRSINIDIEHESAWVEAGATLGEFYYAIAQKSNLYGFNGGYGPTLGVGGHVRGVGLGGSSRKYGTTVDAIIDVKFIDIDGKVLDRNLMGEDLFWAIRGGGAESFGIVVSWKLRLFPVPPKVTVFRVYRTLEEGGGKLLYKWQTIAPRLPKELCLMVSLNTVHVSSSSNNSTIRVTFVTLYLGDIENLVSTMQDNFPDLKLTREDCVEMSWIQSILFYNNMPPNTSLDFFLSRGYRPNHFLTTKIDYVKEPISKFGLEGLFQSLLQEVDYATSFMPFGGRISEISDSETPFPHRNGTLCMIEYRVVWSDEKKTSNLMEWLRNVYSYMEPYVSKAPRGATISHRDFDLGRNNKNGNTSYEEASGWGVKYFKDNFKRLAQVKTAVDPSNFFKNEQSIPVL